MKCFYSFVLSEGKKDYTYYQSSPREINHSVTPNFSNTQTHAHSKQNLNKLSCTKTASKERKIHGRSNIWNYCCTSKTLLWNTMMLNLGETHTPKFEGEGI